MSKKGGLGLVALGTDKGSVSIWDLTRGVVAVKLGEVRWPREQAGGLVRSWCWATGKRERERVGWTAALASLMSGIDRSWVTTRLWPVSWVCVRVQGQSLKSVTGVAFSSSGTQVYTCSSEAEVLEWDIKVGGQGAGAGEGSNRRF